MQSDASPGEPPSDGTLPVAAFEHLTGPSRGSVTWAGEPELAVVLGANGRIRLTARPAASEAAGAVARLRRVDGTYEVVAGEGQPLWVNGSPAERQRLRHRDMIEFGEAGPISRVFLCHDGQMLRPGVATVLSDAAAYVRASRKPLAKRLLLALMQVQRRLARETTWLFRIGVIVALVALGLFAYQQSRINALLRQQIETGSAQLQAFSRLLARTSEEALTPADLDALREALAQRMATTSERVTELERRSTAIGRVIAEASPSVIFLQGAYGFRDAESGRMLRHLLGPDGKPAVLPGGFPLLSLEGDGPVAERQFLGTGFAVEDGALIVTSRHVGEPWGQDVNVAAMGGKGLEPAMLRFVAYLPGAADAIPVAMAAASDEADLAILRLEEGRRAAKGLRLAEEPPDPGDEVIVLGYPTGLRTLLAQAGDAFIEQLEAEQELDFWRVAEKLAETGRIMPLASRGIVGRTSRAFVVYDAETTYGGSGGPVLDVEGAVVAVNTAILPEYGGSNLGVPAAKVRALIEGLKAY